MSTTRRTVLAWILAAVISPPRMTTEPSFNAIFEWMFHETTAGLDEFERLWYFTSFEFGQSMSDQPIAKFSITELGTTSE